MEWGLICLSYYGIKLNPLEECTKINGKVLKILEWLIKPKKYRKLDCFWAAQQEVRKILNPFLLILFIIWRRERGWFCFLYQFFCNEYKTKKQHPWNLVLTFKFCVMKFCIALWTGDGFHLVNSSIKELIRDVVSH